MGINNQNKINRLIADWPVGAVYVTAWLKQAGFSNQLLSRYKKSRWLSSVGSGAFKRFDDETNYQGALYALQHQLNLSIHVGGKTALALQGKAHYLSLGQASKTLFGSASEKLPTWFKQADWSNQVRYYSSSFLPPKLGLVDFECKTFSIKISSPVRALLECLYLAPQHQDLVECYQLLEGLNNLRPQQVQELLVACSSVKVKRLFLYLAKKSNHSWVDKLDISQLNLGTGKRSIVANGVFIPEFAITVPKEIA